MIQQVQLAAPNSLILLLDPDTGVLPASLAESSIAASSTGVIIGTLNEFDGETKVHVGAPSEFPQEDGLTLRWQGTIGTSGRLGVLNIYNEVLLELPANEAARVAIWTNDPDEPDTIWVLVS